MVALQKRLYSCAKSAFSPTWRTGSWLMKLMIPISLTVTLMQHFGILAWIAGYLNPVFSFLGLPGSSAVVFISGAMAGTYAGLAAMMMVQLTLRQATILGIMISLCHALPMECAVNKKTGSSFTRMLLLRVFMAFLAALILNKVIPAGSVADGSAAEEMFVYLGAPVDSSLQQVLATWLWSQTKMSIMVFLIIYLLMVVQRLLEAYGLLQPLSRLLSPLMRLFGLPRNAAYMWLAGNVLGISYGCAVMLDLEEQGAITRAEANDVNYHLIMNHSLLEDTIVFSLTGISALWLAGTRIVAAFLLVWTRITMRHTYSFLTTRRMEGFRLF